MPYCKMFESGLVINPSGTVRPCCHFRNDEDGYKYYDEGWYEHHRELGEIMSNSDEFIPECIECQYMVERNETPMLEDYNSMYKNQEGLVHVELKINNTCNLSCVMCDSWSSSKWHQTIKANPQAPDYIQRVYGGPPNQKWHKDIDSFVPYLLFCKNLKFTGGEPFLIPQVQKIINYCVQQGLAEGINLEFITNGTQDLVQHIDTFREFNRVSVQYSVDAIGDRFNFIRQGADWDDVESKILNFKSMIKNTDISINISAAVQALNINHLDDLQAWCDTHKISLDAKNFVSDPEFMSPEALHDPELRNKLVTVLKELDKIHGTNHEEFLDE